MKDVLTGIIRHLGTFGGGYLVTDGLATQDEVTAAVGALVTLVGFGWSVYSKKAAK